MTISQTMLAELQHEAGNTKRVLERVPTEQFDWKPHEKSTSLGRLAAHISVLPRWVDLIVNGDEVDMAAMKYTPPKVLNSAELMQSFEGHIAAAKAILQTGIEDEEMMKKWALRRGDMVIANLPKVGALRSMVFNHIIHHRAQLGVYLRLLNIPVPAIYGPTADESFG